MKPETLTRVGHSAAEMGHLSSQVVASLVSEIVMCTKEANKKTRAAAYDLLVEVRLIRSTTDLCCSRPCSVL